MPNTILKRWNGTAFEELYPKTTVGQIAASGTANSTTFLRGDGQWATPVDTSTDNTKLPLTGGEITGGLIISGSISSGGFEGASGYEEEATNLILRGDSLGRSGIFFQSEKDGTNINHTSDFGFIQFFSYGVGGSSGESNELVIGTSNDADDHLILQTPSNTGIKARVGESTTDYSVYHDNYHPDADKLTTARTINVSTGASGTATSFDGSANISIPITGVSESYLTWGGKHLSGQVTPVGMSLSNEHSANRLAFINGDSLYFEYSSDAGSTWTDYGYSAATKSQFCTTSVSVPIGRTSGNYTVDSRTRITLTAQNGTNTYVYTNPRKMLLEISSSGGMNVLVETRTGTNYQSGGAWTTFGTYSLSGWSGWNDIPLVLGTLGGGTTQTGNNWQLRLTFIMTSVNASYQTTAHVNKLRIFGENTWFMPSTLAATNDLYSYDMSQNALFPAIVQGTRFTSTVANGTAPLTVTSTTAVTNLNADLLDGNHASAFAASVHTHNELSRRDSITYGLSALQWADISGTGGTGLNGAVINNPTNEWWHHLIMNHNNAAGYYVDLAAAFHSDDLYFRRNVAGSLQSWRKVWHDGNDGASSGLDADLLDGNHASAFYLATNPSGYTSNTGTVTSVSGTGTVSGLTLTGTVTTTGNLTLGGTLSTSTAALSDIKANLIDQNANNITVSGFYHANSNIPTTDGESDKSIWHNQYSNSSSGWATQLATSWRNGRMWIRNRENSTWESWYEVFTENHLPAISEVTGLQTALDAKAALASPALTGTPTAPTATAGTNTTQIATTAFVSTAVSNLINSAPGALDTLDELAAALGDDANFASTITTALAGKASTVHTHTKSDITDFGHTHGNILNDGSISSATVTPADGDRILIADASASPFGKIERGIIIGTGTTTFLRNDGQWATPADATTLTSLGLTATATELNYVDGVTSAIQTQLDAKAALAGATFTGDVFAPRFIANPSSGGNDTSGAWGIADYDDKLSAVRDYITDIYYPIYHTGDKPAIADVTGLQTALDGKASSSHTHAATDITSGTVATARLGSGTADTTTYLRGDNTWSTAGIATYSTATLYVKRIYSRTATSGATWTERYDAGTGAGTTVSTTATWTAIALGYTPSTTTDDEQFLIEFSNNTSSDLEKGICMVGYGTFSSTAGMAVISYDAYETIDGTQLKIAKYYAQWRLNGSNIEFRYGSKMTW